MRPLRLTAMVVALSTVCSAQVPVKFMVSFLAVTQPDSPVKVLGIERRAGTTSPVVTVENVSSKPVKAVRVALAIAAPRGCSPDEHPAAIEISNSGPDSLDYSKNEIAPQQRAMLRGVDIVASAGYAAQLKSRYLQVQLGVIAVEFTDGTSWRRSRARREMPDVFAPKLLAGDSVQCSEWPWIPNVFDNFPHTQTDGWAGAGPNGIQVDTESEYHPKPDPVSRVLPMRYSITCEIRKTEVHCELP